MKKAILLILAPMLALSLAACGGGNDAPAESAGNQGGDTPLTRDDTGAAGTAVPSGEDNAQDIDMGAIFSGNGGDTLISSYDEATRQSIVNDAKEDGYDVEFETDGSMVMTDAATGETITQNADGTWTIGDSEGNRGQVGGDWPDNDFTKLLPQPDFALVGAQTSADQFAVGFSDATVEQVKEYTEKVKDKGFTVGAETQDENLAGMIIFMYSAKNADGYGVEVAFSSGTAGLIITKP
jgi:hypothetical protein